MEEYSNIVNETLIEAYVYTEKLITGIKEYLEGLTAGNYSTAAKKLVEIVEGLEWLFKAVMLMTTETNNDFGLSECGDILKELNNGIRNNDAVLLNDLFEYEILPVLEKFHVNLEEEITKKDILNNVDGVQ